MKRFNERKEDYKNALQRLKEGLIENPNELEIDGILQRFEFTFELSWKCIKDFLTEQGIEAKIGSPREIIHLAFQYHIIADGENWINMMIDRNQLFHLYDSEASRKIYEKIKTTYVILMEQLLTKLEETEGVE